jgi:hypothetical protein
MYKCEDSQSDVLQMTSNSSPSVAQLVRSLEEAFPTDPLPSEIVRDGGGVVDERDEILNDYYGLRWTEVPPEVLGFNTDALGFMTSEGCVYYLPAFIRKYLLDREHADLIPQGIVALLTPGLGDENRFRGVIDRMTELQKRFIAALLEYMRDSHPFYSREAEVALARHWHRR